MKKIIKITESQINRIVNKTLNEDYEMSGAVSRRNFKPTSRELEIKGAFGSYGEDVPPIVLRYIRKNPKSVIQKLYDIYGDRMFDYIKPEFPLDEAKQMTSTQYNLKDPKDLEQFNKDMDGVTDSSKIHVGDEMGQIDEVDLLDEDIFEEEKDIDTWDDVPMMK